MTTQNAPLEKLLNRLRTRKIKKYISGKHVLDFGCGQSAWTARSLTGDCASIVGVDESLDLEESQVDGITLFKHLDSLRNQTFDVILMLAVIEHIRPFDFRDLLNEFLNVTDDQGVIVATIPTTKSRPVLEFLSYKLGLIDPSQIRDHKVYYDDLWLNEILADTAWKLSFYKTFQFGLNSLVVLSRE